MLKGIAVVIVVVLVLTIVVRLVEARFAFFPSAGEHETPRDFGVPYEAFTLSTSDGERLSGWMLRPPAPRAHVVYFHGNGGNLSIWAPILCGIARQGYAVTAIDYRGYGKSSGSPSERGLYRDVDAFLEWFASRGRTGGPIVYWGRSLGTVMAAYAATIRPPDGLVLESGFPDARSLLRASPPMALLALFSTYRFPAAAFMRRVTAPVLVLHGDADGTVPIEQGWALFEGIRGPKTFVAIRGGDHNDAAAPDAHAYWEALARFVAGLDMLRS